jgi:methanogenic corrinoid protein MtbC1
MVLVGEKFEKGDYYLAELMHSARIFEAVMKVIEKDFKNIAKLGPVPKVVIGTAFGDVHDIGKNIVAMILRGNGFEVIDLGVNVHPNVFVDKVKELKPPIVGISALLTTSFGGLKQICDAIRKEKIEPKPAIIIGGGPVTEKVREYSGADFYANDVMAGVKICKSIIG